MTDMDTDGEDVEGLINSKDEHVIRTVHENGYESECSSRSEEDVTRSALEIEADAFTRFIDRQRVEVMFELRHLRLGERPVTGQANRERIETFLNNIQQPQETRTPSTRPIVPSAHIADIDALANRRCVSAALGSAGFRQDLESAIRRSIEIRPIQQIPQAPPMPRDLAPVIIEQQQQQQQHPHITHNPPHIVSVIREQERSPVRQTPLHRPFNIERQERELHAWQTITQLQRDMIVLEISDLVHRQLVTSALESDFRTHLEQTYFTRLAEGAPVIVAPQILPVPVRTTTTNIHTSSATTDALSSRLDSMQQMLRLMLSMQMDMQRSLRQEVAGALANTSITTTSVSQPMNAGHCTICLNAIADTVLYRCGHLCVCYLCGLNLREATSTTGIRCPICRAPVDDILRIYRSSGDGE